MLHQSDDDDLRAMLEARAYDAFLAHTTMNCWRVTRPCWRVTRGEFAWHCLGAVQHTIIVQISRLALAGTLLLVSPGTLGILRESR
jgi:hypothetical protein